MKEIITFENSRLPVWWQDLKFLQEAYKEAIAAIGQGLVSRNNYIIVGCGITIQGSQVRMSAGLAFYEGEIVPVKAMASTPFTGNSPVIKLTRVTAYDAAGLKPVTMQNGTENRDTYRNDYLQGSIAGNNEMYNFGIRQGFWDLKTRLQKVAEGGDTGDVQLPVGTMSYRQVGKQVRLSGNLFNDSLGGFSGYPVSGLPKPIYALRFNSNPHTGTGSYYMLSTDGTLTCYSTQSRIYVDHISYFTNDAIVLNDGHYSRLGDIS